MDLDRLHSRSCIVDGEAVSATTGVPSFRARLGGPSGLNLKRTSQGPPYRSRRAFAYSVRPSKVAPVRAVTRALSLVRMSSLLEGGERRFPRASVFGGALTSE